MDVNMTVPYSPQMLYLTKQDVELCIHYWQRRSTQLQDKASRYQRVSELTASGETSALAVLRKHEKPCMLAVETLSTDSRAHCIRDSKRLSLFRFQYCQIWKFKY